MRCDFFSSPKSSRRSSCGVRDAGHMRRRGKLESRSAVLEIFWAGFAEAEKKRGARQIHKRLSLQHNQSFQYLTGSPPSRQGCRFDDYKTLFCCGANFFRVARDACDTRPPGSKSEIPAERSIAARRISAGPLIGMRRSYPRWIGPHSDNELIGTWT
jgi:hypothetical protein